MVSFSCIRAPPKWRVSVACGYGRLCGLLVQGPDAAAAARQREVHQALARFCTQVSGEAVTEDQVRQFHFRDWRRYTQLYQDRLAVLFAAGSDLDIKARAELASLVGLKVGAVLGCCATPIWVALALRSSSYLLWRHQNA